MCSKSALIVTVRRPRNVSPLQLDELEHRSGLKLKLPLFTDDWEAIGSGMVSLHRAYCPKICYETSLVVVNTRTGELELSYFYHQTLWVERGPRRR
jgi:hypothetical protein